MRSAVTMVLFLALLGAILLYSRRACAQLDGFRGEGEEGKGVRYGSGGSDYGFWNWSWLPVAQFVKEEKPAELLIEDTPCSTDFDCKTGHCGMFGMCTNGLSL
jgi:hypothetical protein